MHMQWRRLGDLAAIPFFALLIWYWLTLPRELTLVEWALLVFAVIGLVFDTASVFIIR
jgi:hypothetical protein